MLVIGLTGPSGAGKTTVARGFSAFGLPIIDADEVYRELLVPPSPCLDALTDEFGTEILLADGTLNRKKLASIVFSDEDRLEALNGIAHRYIMAEIRARLSLLRKQQLPAVVLDAPQLFEAGANRDCNIIVAVLADKRIRLERLLRRDGITAEQALRRMDAQKSDLFFRAQADYVIENNDNSDTVLPHVRRILSETGVLPS